MAQHRVEVIGAEIQQPVDIQSVFSELADSTTMALGASATYTGVTIDRDAGNKQCTRLVGGYGASHSGTLVVQFSDDGTNWDNLLSVTAGTGGVFDTRFYKRYARLFFTNGATLQTSFRLSATKMAL